MIKKAEISGVKELAIGIDEVEPDCDEFFTYNKEGEASVIYNLIKENL